jgi:hypothetical protein
MIALAVVDQCCLYIDISLVDLAKHPLLLGPDKDTIIWCAQ